MSDTIIPSPDFSPFEKPVTPQTTPSPFGEFEALVQELAPQVGIKVAGAHIEERPKLEELGDELPPVPPFDVEILPKVLRRLVVDVSKRMGCVVDYPAAAAVVMLAAVVNRRALIRPKVLDTEWVVIPNLWGLVIGEPGTMKTPAAEAIIGVAKTIEHSYWKEHEIALQRFATEEAKADLDRAGMERDRATGADAKTAVHQ